MINPFSKLSRFGFFAILVLLIFFSIYRAMFAVNFGEEINTDLWWAFYIGFRFDLRLAIFIVLPILLLGWIKWLHPCQHLFGRIFWRSYLLIVFTFCMFIYFLDFGHYSYLKTHLNPTIMRFVANQEIALTMIWQSYPVVWISVLLVLVIAGFNFSLQKITNTIRLQPEYQLKLLKKISLNFLVAVLVMFSLYGKFSWYPLRWIDAHFSSQSFIADLATNPILYGIDALRYHEPKVYDENNIRAVFTTIKQYLKIPQNSNLDFQRPLALTPKINTNANLVLVFLESFAAYKTGSFGNPLNPSPNFDKLAKNSLFFKKYYVAHTGTARSVFTVTTGVPDTHSVKTATRDPLIVNQNTIINSFAGYNKLYFLGGSLNWGNIRGLLAKNIPNLKIYEEGSYSAPSQDVWGISDADLFLEASAILRKQKQPFVAVIQTSGNHRPYTIPKPNYKFKLSQSPEDKVKQYGFESLAELNSFRFMDHSIGLFIKAAKQHGFYENTVFVFFADHGISANNGKHRPKIDTELNLGSYHTPLIIHAPKYIKPKINQTVVSHPDILPIVAGIMGKPYINTSLGRNMLALKYQDQQYAFTIEHGLIPTIGLIGKKFRLTMNAEQKSVKLYDLTKLGSAVNVAENHPEKTQEMQQLANAIYHSAKYLLYHNKSK